MHRPQEAYEAMQLLPPFLDGAVGVFLAPQPTEMLTKDISGTVSCAVLHSELGKKVAIL